jgi:hypothetical protein
MRGQMRCDGVAGHPHQLAVSYLVVEALLLLGGQVGGHHGHHHRLLLRHQRPRARLHLRRQRQRPVIGLGRKWQGVRLEEERISFQASTDTHTRTCPGGWPGPAATWAPAAAASCCYLRMAPAARRTRSPATSPARPPVFGFLNIGFIGRLAPCRCMHTLCVKTLSPIAAPPPARPALAAPPSAAPCMMDVMCEIKVRSDRATISIRACICVRTGGGRGRRARPRS